ncbi:MAG: glycosyltransferase [Marinilabiliaceae bacterium]|nr:glycosyltransferase [Marinilabiliaceae bacterium]
MEMKNRPLLTVVVSCYNLAQYVDRCVSSIVAQTYSNLEIILLNDGSTDDTGIRCDAWSNKDKRIKVIHKQNEGLSYTRKTGVENATADFITFVDVDDWLDKNMYAQMMSALLETNSDIAQCGYCMVFEDGHIEHLKHYSNSDLIEVVGRKEGVLLLLEDRKWRSFLWNKIFKKSLFEFVEFQKNLNLGEDFISLDLFHNAQKTIFLDREYCFYYQRKDSMLNIKDIPSEMKKISDFSDAYFKRYKFVQKYPEYHCALPAVTKMTVTLGMNLIRNIIVFPQYFSKDYFLEKSKQMLSIPLTKNIKCNRNIIINFNLLKINTKLYKFLKIFYIKILFITNKFKITNRQTIRTLHDAYWMGVENEWLVVSG